MNESTRPNECGRGPTGSMLHEQRQGLALLRFPMLSAEPGLRHAVFTRIGGASRGPYSELNVGLGRRRFTFVPPRGTTVITP